jgi:hypothetical protein
MKRICFGIVMIFVLSILAILPDPHIVFAGDSEADVIVGAYYYVWYHNGNLSKHWNTPNVTVDTVIDLPVLDYYSSQNVTVIEQQLGWMKYAGLDFLIISWWGQGSYEDNSTKIVFDVVKNNASSWMKLVIMVEGFNDSLGADAYDFKTIYDYLNEQYLTPYNDIYLKINGKPLVCWFNFDNMTRNKPVNRDFIRSNASLAGCEARIVGQSDYVDWWFGTPFQASSNMTITPMADNVVCVEPRYDETHLGRNAISLAFDMTYSFGLYDIEWNQVLDHTKDGRVKIVTIYSWNEYHERSQIEPNNDSTSMYYDSYYMLNRTKSYIAQIRVIPEFSPFLILPLFMTATLFVVIVYRRKNQRKVK